MKIIISIFTESTAHNAKFFLVKKNYVNMLFEKKGREKNINEIILISKKDVTLKYS